MSRAKTPTLATAVAELRTIAKRDRLGFLALARLIREVAKTADRKAARS